MLIGSEVCSTESCWHEISSTILIRSEYATFPSYVMKDDLFNEQIRCLCACHIKLRRLILFYSSYIHWHIEPYRKPDKVTVLLETLRSSDSDADYWFVTWVGAHRDGT